MSHSYGTSPVPYFIREGAVGKGLSSWNHQKFLAGLKKENSTSPAAYFMKVMCEAPTWRSRRLIVTEHGISYGGRPLGKRSAHSIAPMWHRSLCLGRGITGAT